MKEPRKLTKMFDVGDTNTRENESRAAYLASEGYWRLVKPLLLRVSNVRGDHSVERESMVGLLKEFAVVFGLDGKLATHGVLDVADCGVQSVCSERAHRSRRRAEGP